MKDLIVSSGRGGGAWIIVYDKSTKEYLMARRSKSVNNPGKWNFFGGGIDKGETAKDAAVREMFEESGIKVRKKELHKLGKDKSNRNYFLWIVDKRPIPKLNDEHDKVKWFSKDALPKSINPPTKIAYKFLK